jgi:flagellar hook assembly protein FlgD
MNGIASLDTVDSIQTLNASFASMLQLEQLTSGSSLIGKTVTYSLSSGAAPQTGTVTGLSVQNGQFLVDIGNTRIGLNQISTVM